MLYESTIMEFQAGVAEFAGRWERACLEFFHGHFIHN